MKRWIATPHKVHSHHTHENFVKQEIYRHTSWRCTYGAGSTLPRNISSRRSLAIIVWQHLPGQTWYGYGCHLVSQKEPWQGCPMLSTARSEHPTKQKQYHRVQHSTSLKFNQLLLIVNKYCQTWSRIYPPQLSQPASHSAPQSQPWAAPPTSWSSSTGLKTNKRSNQSSPKNSWNSVWSKTRP